VYSPTRRDEDFVVQIVLLSKPSKQESRKSFFSSGVNINTPVTLLDIHTCTCLKTISISVDMTGRARTEARAVTICLQVFLLGDS
jgi:hypothetical protein